MTGFAECGLSAAWREDRALGAAGSALRAGRMRVCGCDLFLFQRNKKTPTFVNFSLCFAKRKISERNFLPLKGVQETASGSYPALQDRRLGRPDPARAKGAILSPQANPVINLHAPLDNTIHAYGPLGLIGKVVEVPPELSAPGSIEIRTRLPIHEKTFAVKACAPYLKSSTAVTKVRVGT